MNPVIVWGVATAAAVLLGVAFVVLVYCLCGRAERATFRLATMVPTLPGENPSSGQPDQAYSALDAWRRAKTSALEEGASRERITQSVLGR